MPIPIIEAQSPQARELELAAAILVDSSGEMSVDQAIHEARRISKHG